MTEDDPRVEPRAVAGTDHFDEALLYDFAKFLTTLALLALGGVLTLTQTADKQVAKPFIVGLIAGWIALAGVSALSAATKLAGVTLSKRKHAFSPQQMLLAAVGFLGAGAGGFLVLWWMSL